MIDLSQVTFKTNTAVFSGAGKGLECEELLKAHEELSLYASDTSIPKTSFDQQLMDAGRAAREMLLAAYLKRVCHMSLSPHKLFERIGAGRTYDFVVLEGELTSVEADELVELWTTVVHTDGAVILRDGRGGYDYQPGRKVIE